MGEIEKQLKQIEIQIELGIKQKAINSNYGTLKGTICLWFTEPPQDLLQLIESIRNIKLKKDG